MKTLDVAVEDVIAYRVTIEVTHAQAKRLEEREPLRDVLPDESTIANVPVSERRDFMVHEREMELLSINGTTVETRDE